LRDGERPLRVTGTRGQAPVAGQLYRGCSANTAHSRSTRSTKRALPKGSGAIAMKNCSVPGERGSSPRNAGPGG
jgi:hypothetical protein